MPEQAKGPALASESQSYAKAKANLSEELARMSQIFRSSIEDLKTEQEDLKEMEVELKEHSQETYALFSKERDIEQRMESAKEAEKRKVERVVVEDVGPQQYNNTSPWNPAPEMETAKAEVTSTSVTQSDTEPNMESRVHNKQQKRVRECLTDLKEEIKIAVSFLRHLERHSEDSVSRLSTTPPHRQLDEYHRVHSFLIKYLDALTNLNWEFEKMEAEGACDLNFYTNYNCEMYSKKADYDLDEKIYERPQKPFENSMDEPESMKPPSYSEVIGGKSPKLIDFSNPSSDTEVEEVKVINGEAEASCSGSPPDFFKSENKNSGYQGLPLKKDKVVVKVEEKKEEVREVEEMRPVEIQDLRPMEISREVNTEYKGIVEHIVSPSEFYVHFMTNEIYQIQTMKEYLQKISDGLKGKYPYHDEDSDFNEKKAIAFDILGDYALYYCSVEKQWHRARITDWKVSAANDLVSIFLFDYGESKCVSLSSLLPLDASLRKFPIFAQRCHLSGIYPMECKSGEKMVDWSKEEKSLFRILLENNTESESAICRIVIGKNDGCYHPDSIPVVLYTSRTNVSINDEVVDLDYAKRLNPPPTPAVIPKKPSPKKEEKIIEKKTEVNGELEKWDPMKQDYESNDNNYEINTDDPASFIYGYVPKDYERVCHHFNRTGHCYKGITCKKEHVRLDPNGYTTDKEEVYKSAFNKMPAFPAGETILVMVTCFLNVNLFYCVRAPDPNPNPEEETLNSLVDYMNRDDNIYKMRKIAIPPAEGQIVIGQFSEDGKWYRARVLFSIPEDDEYTLFFVDYGNKETVGLSSMRHIEPRYLHLPFQALKCQLYNVWPNPKVNKKQLSDYFLSRFAEKTLRLRIVHFFATEEIYFLTVRLFDEHYSDIGKDFISSNYALEGKSSIFNENSTIIPG